MKIKCKNPARYTVAINRPTIHHKSEPSSNNNCVKGFAFRKTVWKPKTQEHKKRVPLPPRTGLCCSLASIALHVENHRRIIKSRQGAIAFWKSSSCRILSGCMFVFSWQQKWDTAQVECSTPHLSCLQFCSFVTVSSSCWSVQKHWPIVFQHYFLQTTWGGKPTIPSSNSKSVQTSTTANQKKTYHKCNRWSTQDLSNTQMPCVHLIRRAICRAQAWDNMKVCRWPRWARPRSRATGTPNRCEGSAPPVLN